MGYFLILGDEGEMVKEATEGVHSGLTNLSAAQHIMVCAEGQELGPK